MGIRLKQFGSVAASGNTGGAQVPTTVMQFILRGVSIFGIESVRTPIERRRQVWELLGSSMKPAGLDGMIQDVPLSNVEPALDAILAGALTGRTVVDTRV